HVRHHRPNQAPTAAPTRRSSDLDAPARDVEGRAVVNGGAYEGKPERHVNGLAERQALDRNHRLIMVARNDRVELAAVVSCYHDQDRKSTRLNSSHSQISYAVCCL